jgi:transcriptional regulator with XRE-family HTH domain
MRNKTIAEEATKRKLMVVNNIRKLRELRGLTREAVAYEMDISPSGYSKIERGEVEISLHRLFVLERVLQFDLMQLLQNDIADVISPLKNSNFEEKAPFQDTYKERYIQLLREVINS